MDLPKRKHTRLRGYDYSRAGYYFITICTKNKQKLLSEIVGGGVLDAPQNNLLPCGRIAEKQIEEMNTVYTNTRVEKYVIMPNHIHMIINISEAVDGRSGTPAPTSSISVPDFVSAFKRFCNVKYGKNIWQRSFHDHIIRGEKDYLKIWNYIDTNAAKWTEDCFYTAEADL